MQKASKTENVKYIILGAVGLIGNNEASTQPLCWEWKPLLYTITKNQ